MLSKNKRLTTSDFLLIKNLKPRKVFSELGVFCFYENIPKFAIVLSKKTFKTAVSRNLHKRVFYNTLRELSYSGQAFVFYPKKIFSKDDLERVIITF
jgi:ribonuclease P protein component